MTLEHHNVDELLAKLRTDIDRLHSSFEKVKYQILEVARILDESKQCERSYICRKIKQLLQDEIKEGKITSKWIEDCLPEEYKRRYIKSELCSLSEDNNCKDRVQVTAAGTTLLQDASDINSRNGFNLPEDPQDQKSKEISTYNTSPRISEGLRENDHLLRFEFFIPLKDIWQHIMMLEVTHSKENEFGSELYWTDAQV